MIKLVHHKGPTLLRMIAEQGPHYLIRTWPCEQGRSRAWVMGHDKDAYLQVEVPEEMSWLLNRSGLAATWQYNPDKGALFQTDMHFDLGMTHETFVKQVTGWEFDYHWGIALRPTKLLVEDNIRGAWRVLYSDDYYWLVQELYWQCVHTITTGPTLRSDKACAGIVRVSGWKENERGVPQPALGYIRAMPKPWSIGALHHALSPNTFL